MAGLPLPGSAPSASDALDPYEMLRSIQTQIYAPTSYVDPEANGLLQSDSLGPSYHYGDALLGTPYESKYSGAMTQVEPGLYMANFQRPGGHKYDTLSAYYRIDPETGMAVMEGDPFETRQTSKRETVKDFLEHGVPLVAAAAGAGYALNPAYGNVLGAAGGTGATAGMEGFMSPELVGGSFGTGSAQLGTAEYLAATGTLGTIPAGSGIVEPLATAGTVSAPEIAALASTGANAMGWLDVVQAGIGLVGLYNNNQAIDEAGDAARDALDANRDISGRQLDMADTQYQNYLTNIQPELLSDIRTARDRATTVAGQADQLFNLQFEDAQRYSDRWNDVQVPLEDRMRAEAMKLGTKDEQDRLAGLAVADTRGQFADMRRQYERNAARQGINPASGAAQAMSIDAFQEEALAGASNAIKSRAGAYDRYRSGMMDVAALGRGLPGFSSSAASGANSSGGLTLNAGQAPINASTAGSNANTAALNGVNNMWGSAATTNSQGVNGMTNYANLVNNGALSTLAGYGWSNWMPSGTTSRGG